MTLLIAFVYIFFSARLFLGSLYADAGGKELSRIKDLDSNQLSHFSRVESFLQRSSKLAPKLTRYKEVHRDLLLEKLANAETNQEVNAYLNQLIEINRELSLYNPNWAKYLHDLLYLKRKIGQFDLEFRSLIIRVSTAAPWNINAATISASSVFYAWSVLELPFRELGLRGLNRTTQISNSALSGVEKALLANENYEEICLAMKSKQMPSHIIYCE